MLNFPRWKMLAIIFAVVLGIIFALPNVVDKQAWSKLPLVHELQPMVLGLDLQGGSHVLLEVDRVDLQNGAKVIGNVKATRITIADDYREASAQFEARFGKGQSLRKALLTRVKQP